MGEILTQSINFEKKQIESSFMKLHKNSTYIAKRIIYYPYYYFIYNVKAKRVFMPMKEKIGCAVDAVSGKGLLVDYKPVLERLTIPDRQLLKQTQSFDDCLAISESFLYRSVSLKLRIISVKNVQMEQGKLFYRPYWIVFQKNEEDNDSSFIVDAVTGQYHPL